MWVGGGTALLSGMGSGPGAIRRKMISMSWRTRSGPASGTPVVRWPGCDGLPGVIDEASVLMRRWSWNPCAKPLPTDGPTASTVRRASRSVARRSKLAERQSVKVTSRVHPLVQYANDRDAVVGRSEVDGVPLHPSPSVARSDKGAVLGLVRRFSQSSASGFDEVCIVLGLPQAPALHRVIEDAFHIALRLRAEPVFSYARRFCAA